MKHRCLILRAALFAVGCYFLLWFCAWVIHFRLPSRNLRNHVVPDLPRSRDVCWLSHAATAVEMERRGDSRDSSRTKRRRRQRSCWYSSR